MIVNAFQRGDMLDDMDPIRREHHHVQKYAPSPSTKAPIAAAPLTRSFAKSVMALNASSPWSRTATKVRSEPTVTDLAFISYSRAPLGSSARLRPLNFIALNDVVPAKPVNSHRSESCRW